MHKISSVLPYCIMVNILFLLCSFVFSSPSKISLISPVHADTLSTTYTNPVGTSEGPIRMGDPFAIKHRDRYYLYATAGGAGFNCWTSLNLVHWMLLGPSRKKDENSWGGRNFWAPEVFTYRGKFYMVYSSYKRDAPRPGDYYRICLAVSDKPEGPFVDLYTPWCDTGEPCIDGHVFVDDNGTPYLYFARNYGGKHNNQGYMSAEIYVVKLSDDLSHAVTDPALCMKAEQEWENPASMDTRCNEGPFILKHSSTYYMTYSANHYRHPFYGIGYATARSPMGPWEKSSDNPLVAQNTDIGVAGPGHNSITTSPDGKELFIVYHTHADVKEMRGRVLNIDRLIFDDTGKLKLIGPTRSPQQLPSGTK